MTAEAAPNNRAGVDAGLTALFAFGHHWPGTTLADRYAFVRGHRKRRSQ